MVKFETGRQPSNTLIANECVEGNKYYEHRKKSQKLYNKLF